MKLHQHAAASAAISAVLYGVFRSWGMAAACLLSGVFIDLDHILDYLREHGRPFDVKEFFHVCHERKFSQGVLVLHGWEWAAAGAALAWAYHWEPWLAGLAIGLGQHLVLDQLANGVSPWGYFFLWRFKNGFAFEPTFPAAKRVACPDATARANERDGDGG